MCCLVRYYNLHRRSNFAFERSARCFDDCQRRIVQAVSYKDYFETRVILAKDRGKVLAQAGIDSAQRHEDGNERSEISAVPRQLMLHITNKAHATSKREQPKPDGNGGKEIEREEHERLWLL
jgi:hypothetical protein